jgi:hypothetical protein
MKRTAGTLVALALFLSGFGVLNLTAPAAHAAASTQTLQYRSMDEDCAGRIEVTVGDDKTICQAAHSSATYNSISSVCNHTADDAMIRSSQGTVTISAGGCAYSNYSSDVNVRVSQR